MDKLTHYYYIYVLKSLVLLIKRQECERGAAKRRKDKELVDEDRESCTVELSDHIVVMISLMIKLKVTQRFP